MAIETPPPVYEKQLHESLAWGLQEGGMHFERDSAVFKVLRRVTAKLDELGIDYAVVGGMAMFAHGYERFTEDVDILVTKEGLEQIHKELEGRGYRPPFAGSKHLRDTEFGVRVEFLTTGEFPGDGKPKPVAFPDPTAASIEIEGTSFLNLPALIELKLASGMTNPGRLRDLADVLELIRALSLSRQFADQLNPYVREKYLELRAAVDQDHTEY
jgi:hypothetical protein